MPQMVTLAIPSQKLRRASGNVLAGGGVGGGE
jgi:hypothetical protein